MKRIEAGKLTRDAFAPFGDVIETEGAASFLINADKCRRFHDLASVETAGENARVLINIFRGTPYALPLQLSMVERHPLGTQAFMPLSPAPFLVIVCPDEGGKPGEPRAFVTRPGQGVNYARGTWHGVLTPIGEPQDFVVVDRGGDGNNLEEFHFPDPFEITVPSLT
ncbi:ureidoglycolate lyase [Nitratireductor aquibiodomus]|uniref:Ureidoglycolate lyase n=1 Tax=Nitratireductor aquibiodomus TaxID=204799 RepID=A0A1H4JP83_9HYPH|nr:ureidoglycolate lyase [Nitratireductor aquibiodomus]SEB47422.1 ureidoglycolate lyase [Nitratireductor aquibiodomus]